MRTWPLTTLGSIILVALVAVAIGLIAGTLG